MCTYLIDFMRIIHLLAMILLSYYVDLTNYLALL